MSENKLFVARAHLRLANWRFIIENLMCFGSAFRY